MKKLSRAIALAMGVSVMLSMSGCANTTPTQGKADSKDTILIGFSQIGAESEWRTANTNSVKDAAEADKDVTLQFSDAQQKQENQIKAIRSFIAQDVDIIAFVPIVETGWDTVLKEAKDAEIPVMIMDRDATVESDDLYVCKIGTNMVTEGESAFKWIDEYMTKENKKPRAAGDAYQIAILEGTVGSSAAVGRAEGFSNAMKASSNAAKYNILLSQTGEFTRAKGKEVMESFLKSNKDDIDILFAHNDDMALGAIQAIEEAGLKPGKDIVILSIDATKGAFEAMIEGKMNCTVECNPLQGPLMIETAKKILAGEKVDERVYMVDEVFPAEVAKETLPNRAY